MSAPVTGESAASPSRSAAEERTTRKEQAERTREALIDAAAVEFSIHGVGGTRTEDILRRAGVTKGALYHHFKTKEVLVESLIDGKYDVWPGIIEGVKASGTRGLAAIRDTIAQVAVAARDNVRVRAAMRITKEMNASRPYPTPFLRWEETFMGFLQQSLADGEISEEMNIRVTASVIVHVAWGVMAVAEESGTADRVEQSLDDMWLRFYRGIFTGDGPTPVG